MSKLIDLRYKDIGESRRALRDIKRRARYKYPSRIKITQRVEAIVAAAIFDCELKHGSEWAAKQIIKIVQNNYRRRRKQ